jgi:acetylcholinesterase
VLHGTSAGAGSVAMHLIAYGGRDDHLFTGVIAQSGFFPTQRSVSDLEFQFDRFVHGAGCSGAEDELACLRSQDTSVLQAANVQSAYPGAPNPARFYFTPCIDGDLIRDYPIKLFVAGKFIHVPIIFGTDTDEGSVFAPNASTPEEVSRFMQAQFPRLTPEDTDAINDVYPLMAPLPLHAPYFPSVSAAFGESTFVCPSTIVLQSYVKQSHPETTWSYRINIQEVDAIEAGLGVRHTFEIPAIFGPGYAGEAGSFATYNAAIVPIIMHYWISFVRALDPNAYKHESAPIWKTYGNEQRKIVLETNATVLETVNDELLERCKFWEGLTDTLEF